MSNVDDQQSLRSTISFLDYVSVRNVYVQSLLPQLRWWGYSWVFLVGSVLSVTPDSPNPDPILGQKMSFSDLAFKFKAVFIY